MSAIDHEALGGEGNLHALSDDDYFDDLTNHRVPVYDADGREVRDLYADVIDARPLKKEGLL